MKLAAWKKKTPIIRRSAVHSVRGHVTLQNLQLYHNMEHLIILMELGGFLNKSSQTGRGIYMSQGYTNIKLTAINTVSNRG